MAITKVLVANRGEIAVRVMRTCKERNIETVAVYSDVDRKAPHVLMADYAVPLGGAAASESYLRMDAILAACKRTGANAVHPGYGFLSENEDFAQACADAGIIFLGPSPHAIFSMGSKTEARKTVMAAGTPVVPGDNGPEGKGFATSEQALASAAKIGYPVLLKAAAGGGGKGMRMVSAASELPAAFDGARREALAAFGDDTVYLEKAVMAPRHIEIQIFGDQHGNIVYLGERDCSIQRRHQKVIEEAPSPVVSSELRTKMGEAAVAAARAVNYVGAGTCEFLLSQTGEFYFLEMNTRLQVEHPVTEMIFGVDLVGWQLDVAEGKKLPSQSEINAMRRGHAVECRIYAEDSVKFLPSPGTITGLRVPDGPWVRNDSGCYEGSEISMYYDPMISKLIVWGPDRATAVQRMRRALDEYDVRGIDTNLAFHRQCIRHPAFVEGEYDTGFIAAHHTSLLPAAAPGSELDAALAALALAGASKQTASAGASAQPHANGTSVSSTQAADWSNWRRAALPR